MKLKNILLVGELPEVKIIKFSLNYLLIFWKHHTGMYSSDCIFSIALGVLGTLQNVFE